MSEQAPKRVTMTTEELSERPADTLRDIRGDAPLVVTRDGRVWAYVFRRSRPLNLPPDSLQ